MPDEFLRLLAELSHLDLYITIYDAGLLHLGPANRISSDLRDRIARYKAQLIQHIREQEGTS